MSARLICLNSQRKHLEASRQTITCTNTWKQKKLIYSWTCACCTMLPQSTRHWKQNSTTYRRSYQHLFRKRYYSPYYILNTHTYTQMLINNINNTKKEPKLEFGPRALRSSTFHVKRRLINQTRRSWNILKSTKWTPIIVGSIQLRTK